MFFRNNEEVNEQVNGRFGDQVKESFAKRTRKLVNAGGINVFVYYTNSCEVKK